MTFMAAWTPPEAVTEPAGGDDAEDLRLCSPDRGAQHALHMSGALLTDFYELTMVDSYLRRQMTGLATFSLFVRDLPANRGFLASAGVGDCLDWLEQFSFTSEHLDYLAGAGFGGDSLEAFAALRFDGEVWAVPEGRSSRTRASRRCHVPGRTGSDPRSRPADQMRGRLGGWSSPGSLGTRPSISSHRWWLCWVPGFW